MITIFIGWASYIDLEGFVSLCNFPLLFEFYVSCHFSLQILFCSFQHYLTLALFLLISIKSQLYHLHELYFAIFHGHHGTSEELLLIIQLHLQVLYLQFQCFLIL
jgi:hypothetical protein